MASNLETGASVSPELEYAEKPEGPVSAAILAAGVGAFALGVLTTLAEASEGLKQLLNLYDPVGPLSGKTVGAVIVWLVAWAVLHVMYRGKAIETRKALTASLILIGLGVLGTFPIFFQAFAAE
ncbi:hypothetical protein [Georgenia daeguensis]|uniref:Uncharacterized protein n=1 Tax=Georgenia daeguensis TaxID=908355 RepID=A0ABP8ERA7_9MICO